MRIVFNKTTGAVLAAGQLMNGDTIIDPTAVQVFPGYNGTYHSSFTLDSGFPLDISTNSLNYMVDNVSLPTTVVIKNHIELIVASSSMTADGVSTNLVTVNVKDYNNNPVVGTYSLDVIANGIFVQQDTLAFTGSSTSFNAVAGNVTGYAAIQVVDNNLDPVANVPSLTLSAQDIIKLSPSGTAQSPLSSVGASGLRTISMLFSEAGMVQIGSVNHTVDGTPAAAIEPEGQMTAYPCVGVSIGGIKSTTFATVNAKNFRKLYVRFKTKVLSTQRWWIGMFSADPMASDNPTTSFGIRFSTSGSDSAWAVYYNDGVTSFISGSGVIPTDNTLVELVITYDPNLNGGTLTWSINGTQIPFNSLGSGGIFTANTALGLVAEVNNTGGNANAGIKMSAVELQYL